MKHRVREAVFDLLGPDVVGRVVVDLFAGAGALGLEAISRGAEWATLIERHIPTAKLIERNAAQLGVADRTEVLAASAFVWARRDPIPSGRLLAFISPPYDFYVEKRDEMLALIRKLADAGGPDSILVVEADDRFDMGALPQADQWRVRAYPPAVLAVLRRTA